MTLNTMFENEKSWDTVDIFVLSVLSSIYFFVCMQPRSLTLKNSLTVFFKNAIFLVT